MATRTASLVLSVASAPLLALSACNQGTSAGTLVGRYAVHAVLVENTCGSGLPAQGTLDFQVELREQDGVGYWSPAKGSRNSGSLSEAGTFRFSASRTTVITQSMPAQLQPGDFVSLDPDRDLKQQRGCAVTTDETISGNLQRWRKTDGSVTASALAADASSTDDLSAEHAISVAPSSGSDCDPALAAYGGKYNALPCKARYQMRGSLDTTGSGTARAGASATRAGSGGS
jgi:hypothetical protein